MSSRWLKIFLYINCYYILDQKLFRITLKSLMI
jgi:hypothetical protein